MFYRNCKGDYIYSKVNELYRSTQGKGYNQVAYMGDTPIFDKSLFNEIQWMPFEMIEVPVPVGYDKLLRLQYGDYMQFPPEAERVTHAYFDFAPDIPYKEYIVKNEK